MTNEQFFEQHPDAPFAWKAGDQYFLAGFHGEAGLHARRNGYPLLKVPNPARSEGGEHEAAEPEQPAIVTKRRAMAATDAAKVATDDTDGDEPTTITDDSAPAAAEGKTEPAAQPIITAVTEADETGGEPLLPAKPSTSKRKKS